MAAPSPNNGTIPATSPTTSPFTAVPNSPTVRSSTSTPFTTPPTATTPTASVPNSLSPPPTSTITTPATSLSTTLRPVTSFVTKSQNGQTPGTTETIIQTQTSVQAVTKTQTAGNAAATGTEAAASASSSAAAGLASSDDSSSGSGGLKSGGKIAIAVVIPIVVVALLVLAGLWFWRKRKARKDAEEARRKEMEEYGLNPNHDPTLPAVGGSSTNGDEASTMRERDGGYRGWGTTSSNTRKASTTLSSNPGMARSDSGGNGYKGQNSPTGNMTQISDPQSGDPLMGNHNEEAVGALGSAPAASGNRGGVNRGPSNASSAYSGANRSDVSAISEGPLPNGSPPYAQDYMYPEESGQNGWGDGQPVIRDVSARRNTRIENPSVVPQQGNAGIAQNF